MLFAHARTHSLLAAFLLAVLALAAASVSARPRAGEPLFRPPVPPAVTPSASPEGRLSLARGYGRLPLQFEVNRGQTDPRVRFLSRGAGYTMFLTGTEAVLVLRGNAECRMQNAECRTGPARRAGRRDTQDATRSTVLRMKMVGAASRPAAMAEARLPGVVNYFKGKDPAKWRTNIPTYAKARFRGVYPGIDMVYYGNQGQLEYDFVVAPGADPKRIRLAFEGADKITVDRAGDLVLAAGGQEVRFRKPRVYQEVAGRRVAVATGWALDGPAGSHSALRTSHFRLATYDRTRPLVIDPVLAYSTCLGGGGNDYGGGIAVDGGSCAYVTGTTWSTDFPVTAGANASADPSSGNVFVAKLSEAGTSLVYSTFFGGAMADAGGGIAVDEEGCAYVTGNTNSPDFPITEGGTALNFDGVGYNPSSDAFLAKLSAAGTSLIYSTCLGGSYIDRGQGITVDGQGCAWITGYTQSTDFPVTAGGSTHESGQDAFVARISATGTSLAFSTCLGGNKGDGGSDIAVDAQGRAYVVGTTTSTNFPVTAGGAAYHGDQGGHYGGDAWVARLSADGASLDYSTCLGGSRDDSGNGIAVDAQGCAYVTGMTWSTNFPVTAGGTVYSAGEDAFVAKLSAAGTSLVYSTYLGGRNSEYPRGIAVDGEGCAYVTGNTTSTDFPIVAGGTANAGYWDAFITKLSAAGTSLVYSTCLGTAGSESGANIAVDGQGCAYVIGSASSPDFPVTAGGSAVHGSSDSFVAKFRKTLMVGPAAQLVFRRQLIGGVALQPILPPVTVAVQDADGNTVETATNTVTLSLGTTAAGAHLLGTLTVAAINGVATFSGLSIDKPGAGYTLVASSEGLAGATSTGFDVSLAPVKVAFTSQPTNATADAVIAPGVKVSILDPNGRLVATAAHQVTLRIAAGPAGGALSGTTSVAATAGVATFANLSLNKAGTYFLRAAATGLTGATSTAFAIIAGPASKLAFTAQPANAAAGAILAPVQVAIRDSLDNLCTGATNAVTLAIASGPVGGSLSGTTTASAVRGVATFSRLSLNKIGTFYRLRATGAGLTGATSAAFTITVGPAAKLAFTVQPSNASAGAAISPAVKVAVRDRYGNTCTGATNRVTMAIASGPAGTTLSGITNVAPSGGFATFANLSLNKAGTYYLRATAAGLTSATSTAFVIASGPARKMVFTRQPVNAAAGALPAVQVTLQDAQGNACPAATNAVTVALGVNPTGALLAGTKTVNAVRGVVTFGGLGLSKAGTGYALRVTATGLTTVTSTPFTITAGPPARLAFTTQPAGARAGAVMASVRVGVQDRFGNPVPTAANAVIVRLSRNPTGAALSGALTRTASSGVATFADLRVSKAGAGYTLAAAAAGLTGATSAAFNVAP